MIRAGLRIARVQMEYRSVGYLICLSVCNQSTSSRPEATYSQMVYSHPIVVSKIATKALMNLLSSNGLGLNMTRATEL